MGHILAVVGQKGGIGKTNAALSLAVEWRRRGLEVLVVDTDRQGTVETWWNLGKEGGYIDDLPAMQRVAVHEVRAKLPPLAKAFDVVVLDMPPRLEVVSVMLAACDQAIVPFGASSPDVWSLFEIVPMLKREAAKRRRRVASLLPARWPAIPHSVLAPDALQAVERCGVPLLESHLRELAEFRKATRDGIGVTVSAPRSDASLEVQALADELEQLAGRGIPQRRQARAVNA